MQNRRWKNATNALKICFLNVPKKCKKCTRKCKNWARKCKKMLWGIIFCTDAKTNAAQISGTGAKIFSICRDHGNAESWGDWYLYMSCVCAPLYSYNIPHFAPTIPVLASWQWFVCVELSFINVPGINSYQTICSLNTCTMFWPYKALNTYPATNVYVEGCRVIPDINQISLNKLHNPRPHKINTQIPIPYADYPQIQIPNSIIGNSLIINYIQ